jgi:hypothetical protein
MNVTTRIDGRMAFIPPSQSVIGGNRQNAMVIARSPAVNGGPLALLAQAVNTTTMDHAAQNDAPPAAAPSIRLRVSAPFIDLAIRRLAEIR